MIQRPKTTPSGLKEEDHRKLVIELTKYAEEGASDSELKQFRETFISQKKKSIQDEKGSSVSNIPQRPQTGTTALPSADGSSATPVPTKETEEEDYFTGSFGNVLRGIDKIVPLGIGDFVDDMARSAVSGYRQGKSDEESFNMGIKGPKTSYKEIQQFIDAKKNAEQLAPSAEMQNYQKIYEEEGKGFWGVVKGIANNPTAFPEIMLNSFIRMASNSDALKAGGAAIGTGATVGASTGALAGGVGAIPGAVAGAASAVPYAFGLASSVVEAGSTFGELLTDELKGKELTKENVKAILENPEKLSSIRNKAIARGVIIGTVDALTGKLASGVGAKILSKSAAKSAVGQTTKSAVVKSTAAGSAIEALGGSLGEAAARGAIGQEMDTSEIALEGLAELPGGIRSTIQARFSKPSYRVNGEKVKAEDIDNLIETMTPEQLTSTKIDIKNDYQGREFKIRDKVLTNSIKEDVKKANPNLNEPSLNAITELEKQLQTLEGNKTQTGKDKASALKQQIKDIQENQLKDETVSQTVETIEAPEETKKRTDRIAELENILSPEAETQVPVNEKIELEKELETLKKEQDAIQKQTTDESVLRTEQPELELQGVGEGNAKPEGVTAKESIAIEKPQEELIEIPTDEIEALKEDISRAQNEGTLSENIDEKVYRGNEEGTIKIEGQQYIFETNQFKHELGNIDEVGDTPLASLDISIFPQEGMKTEPITEGEKPSVVSVDGKEYTFLRQRRPKKGESIVVLKDNETGLQKAFRGDKAERILKDISLQKPAVEKPLTLTVEGKEGEVKTAKEIKREQRLANKEARQEFEAKSLEEIDQMQKELDAEASKIEQELLQTIAKESKKENRLIFKLGEKEFAVTQKADKEFSVSQKNKEGKFVGIKDEKSRTNAIEEFKKIKESKDTQRLKDAEDLSNEYKKEQEDKILKVLDKAIEATSSKGKAFDATLGIPLMIANNSLKIVKAAYKGGKSLTEAISEGYKFLKDKGYGVSEFEFKKYVLNNISKPTEIVTPESKLSEPKPTTKEKQKSAPSPIKSDIYFGDGRIISIVKDIAKITMTEKAALAKQLRDKARGARESVAAFRLASQEVAKEIKELKEKGSITATQAANIISKFSKVNLLNESSVSNFVDYMAKVFADADYDNKINVAKGKLKAAKKNINTKIGIADGLVGPLQKLFSINPNLIPDSKLERYLELVDMFGARQAVLTLEEKTKLTNDVLDILDEINNEHSKIDELSQRFNYSDNQVIEDGKLNYTATVKNMLKEGEITEEEAVLMTKYKSEIIPQVEKTKATDEEIQKEKDELLAEVKKSTINADDLPTRIERDAAKKLAALIKSPAVKELSNAQLKNLLKVIDNINNGYFAHSAQLIIEEINSNNNSKPLKSSVLRAVLLPLSKLYAKSKSIITRKDAVLEMIRRNPLMNIDQVLGDFKTKDVFNSLLEKAAEGEAKFTAELKAIQLKLANAEEKIAKSFKLDANKTLMSKFKMMTYMVQLEYESNPDSKQVNPASKFIEATINHINEGKSQFGEKDAEMLQEILNKYTDTDGNIDTNKLYNSFNSAEKAGIKTIQEVNQSLKEKAEYTASVVRGQRINPLSNYIHLNVLSDTKPNDLASGESFADQYNNSLKPSTKAKSLIERTGKVSPLNFDVFASAQKGAKFVLMDYNLTEPIRTARKTINKTIAALGKVDKDKRRIINAINNSFEEAIENLVNNSYMETSVGDDVANYIKKQGYRSVLAGTGRFAAEFLSNVGFVIVNDPITFSEGLKYTSTMMSPDAPSIMHNVNSKEINRIFPSDTLSGRLIDTNILNEANGIRGGKAKNKVINKVQQIWNLTGKKYTNAIELTADMLITTPDKAIMRPLWFGAFASNFKTETGQDVDFKKIAANDESYMNKYKEAIDKAKDVADEKSVITGASNNAFTGILKGTSKPNQSNFIKGFNNFNNFMSRFLIYEYTSARTGIMAAMGNGSLSRRQGVALLGAVTTRMTVYSLLSKALGSGLIGLLFGDDEDEEEQEKSLDKSIGQALTSTFTSLLFNRDFGNSTKTIINYGLERINENYLQALREGKYDPYKDAIQYTAVPIEKKGKQTGIYDYIENVSGAYGPAIKTANLIIKTYSEDDKKEARAIKRQQDVKNIRIPLEVLGNAGFIPLYKEIRKEVMNEIYKDLKSKRGISREELKKSDPEMYKIMYGKD